MARETKAERIAREAQERFLQEEEQRASYPQRLMEMLERATKMNFELTVKNGQFLLADRDARSYSAVESDETVKLTLDYDSRAEQAIQELDWRVELKEEREREARRKIEVRNQALNKLTQEEREILGI